jgi:GTPase
MVGSKVSIISPKPQATRHKVMGVITRDVFQCVLFDTPGLLDGQKYSLHQKMMASVGQSLKNVDGVVAVVDSTQVSKTGLNQKKNLRI